MSPGLYVQAPVWAALASACDLYNAALTGAPPSIGERSPIEANRTSDRRYVTVDTKSHALEGLAFTTFVLDTAYLRPSGYNKCSTLRHGLTMCRIGHLPPSSVFGLGWVG